MMASLNTVSSEAGSCSHSAILKSDFVSLIKFNGIPILPPLLSNAEREEMRRYRHSAVMLESKLRASARQRMLMRLQTTVEEINDRHCSVPFVTDDSHVCDDEYCHVNRKSKAASVECDETAQSMSVDSRCLDDAIDTAAACDHTEHTSQTDRIEVENEHTWLFCDEGDERSILLDIGTRHNDVTASEVEERDKIITPSSPASTAVEPDSNAITASSCMLMSMSHISRDSGVSSKAVADSIIVSQSTVTESSSITTDMLNSSGDRSSGLNVLATVDMKVDDSNKFDGIRQQKDWQSLCENLSTQSTDDQNTLVDVRSSIMSTGTDDTVNLTIVETGKQTLSESVHAAETADEHVTFGDGQTKGRDACFPADVRVSCLGSQDQSYVSNSDSEDDAIVKTVVAVRTKAVDHTDSLDSVKLFESDNIRGNVELWNDGTGLQLNPRKVCDEFAEEQDELCKDSDLANSTAECGSHQTVMMSTGQTEHTGTYRERTVVLVDDGNAVGESSIANELLSTLSTELDQYMAECAPLATDTSVDSQTLDDSQLLSNLMAKVKLFAVDEDLRGGDFLQSNNSNNSPICSPESAGSNELSRRDVAEQLSDFSLEQLGHGGWQDDKNSQIPLTASIEELKLQPSKKKLDFDEPMIVPFFLEPPDGYRDGPVLEENGTSFMSADQSTGAALPTVDMNMQAKEDHLQRYLQSLATMPGCDATLDETDSCRLQDDSNVHSQSVNYSGLFDGDTDLPCHECSASLLMPGLLQQSDGMAEDEYVELQLQQYEIMKQQLMAEHRRSLERLLAEQERQMSLLRSSLMSQTMLSTSSQHMPNAATATSKPKHCKGKVIPSEVQNELQGQSLVDDVQHSDQFAVGQDQQTVTSHDQHIISETSGDGKTRSPAGVFIGEQPRISREPSCSTIRSDDTESEFAYKSPAVLRRSRRHTPTCSPRDVGKSQLDVDSAHHDLMSTQYSHPSLDHQTVNGHIPRRRYVDVFAQTLPDDVQKKCEKLSALVKGYLVRRLFKTEKVQSIIKTIWDTGEFALQFQTESPIKQGQYSTRDRFLLERIFAQLNSAIYEFHEIFFDTSTAARMQYIAHDRAIRLEKRYRSKGSFAEKSRRISAVSMKTIERRNKILAEKNDHSLNTDAASKSRTTEKPSQAGSCSSRHSAAITGRSSRSSNSPRKPQKDPIHRMVMREKSRAAGSNSRPITSPSRPRIIYRHNKPRIVTGSQTSNPPTVKPTRKIAPSTTKLSQRYDTTSRLAPTEPRTAVTSHSAKLSFKHLSSQRSDFTSHKSTVASKSG